MATSSSPHSDRRYDRDFLLSPEKRNQLIELWEIEKYGRDCFGDPDHVHLYGMTPQEWYERGVRILARTCLEAVKDPLGNKIGEDVAEVVTRPSSSRPVGVVDPFAGSCNGLYAILRHLPGAKGIGFEVEPAVFDLTTRNMAHLKAPIELVQGSYKDLVGSKKHPVDHRVVVFLAPPWGDALHPVTGLHLDRTKPAILEIVRDFERVYGAQPVLYVTDRISGGHYPSRKMSAVRKKSSRLTQRGRGTALSVAAGRCPRIFQSRPSPGEVRCARSWSAAPMCPAR
jgi:hypothetical protein